MTTAIEGLLVRLTALLDGAGIPFMVAGSFASTAHGVPRTTQDIDVVDADAPRDALRRRSMFNAVDMTTA